MKAHIVLPAVGTDPVKIPISIDDRYAKALINAARTKDNSSDQNTTVDFSTDSMVTVRIARTLISQYDSIQKAVSYHSIPLTRIKIDTFQGKDQFIFANLGSAGSVGIIWDMGSERAVKLIKNKYLRVTKEETGAIVIVATRDHLISSSIAQTYELNPSTTAITLVIPANAVSKFPEGVIDNMLKQYENTVANLRIAAREKFIDLLVDESYALTVSGHNAIRGINRNLREQWEKFKIMLEDPSGGIIELQITSSDPENFEEVSTDNETSYVFEVSGVISDDDDADKPSTYLFTFSKK